MNQNSLTGEWRLADLTTNKDWVLELDESDQKEIMDATNISIESRKSLFDLKSLDFPLNKFIAKLEEAKHQLKNGLGFVLLRNLPVNQFSDKNIKIMFWGIGQYLGFPEPQDKAGSLLHVVTDTGAEVKTSDNVRGFQTNQELQFHTDGGDAFGLLCIRAAKKGGLSKLVSSVAIFKEIERQRPDLATELQQNFYFDTRSQNPNDSKFQSVPVFIKHDGLVSALHKRQYIETAQRFSEVPKLTIKQVEALDMVDRLCNSKEFCFDIKLKPGDMEIANNATTFHSRENYQDFDDINKRRCMLRLWLTLHDGRPLPNEYKHTREWAPTFNRRKKINELRKNET
jgi:hypothetical protein